MLLVKPFATLEGTHLMYIRALLSQMERKLKNNIVTPLQPHIPADRNRSLPRVLKGKLYLDLVFS